MDWSLPELVSTFGEIDSIFWLITVITGVIFLGVEVALIYLVIRYRHREGRKAEYVHGHLGTEVVWTVIPFLIVLFLGFKSAGVWLEIKDPRRFPEEGVPLKVTAKQFEWNITYPGSDGRLDTGDDFIKRNQLHVPVGVPIRVTLTAEDVIHSFFLPQFRVKQDAVPGMEIQVWFQATKTGEYVLGCAELCGLGHYKMKGSVTVHTPEEFERWQAEEFERQREEAAS
ncbi:MAG: cytochrome c oxidase subunit II [Gemmatimonadetes bacterium]|nr:cytochrome c oxidase subunit II [Gemmatimonadota bacterium]